MSRRRRLTIATVTGQEGDAVDRADLWSLGLEDDFDDLSEEEQQRVIERVRYWMVRERSEERGAEDGE